VTGDGAESLEDLVAAEVAVKRRRRLIGVAVAVVALVTAGVVVSAQMISSPSSTSQPGPTQEIQMDSYTSDDGIMLSVTTSYSEDRVLTSPSTSAGDTTGGGFLWPLDGVDHEGQDLDPISLPAGTEVEYSVWLKPGCGDLDESPTIRFSIPATLSDGKKVVDTFVASNPEDYEPAVRIWCDVGVGAQAGGTLKRGGAAKVFLTFNNGRSDEIVVKVPALSTGSAAWQGASATVPAGDSDGLIIEGNGVSCHRDQEVPWAEGRILVNGQPMSVPVADTWC
jgi:hypothetical protein